MAVKVTNKRLVRKPKVEYIIDAKEKKTKVIIPIEEFERLLEDLQDLSILLLRKNDN